jgi:excisionase family DNA binding protein
MSATAATTARPSPWLTVRDAAAYARCGTRLLYREVRAGRLRAARVGGRRDLRILTEWLDAWLIVSSEGDPARQHRRAAGDAR